MFRQTEVCHYQIRRHGEDAFFSIDDQTPIHGLDSLIEHYREDAHGLVTQLLHMVKGDAPPHDSRSHGRTNLLHRATKESAKDGYSTVIAILESRNYNIDAKNQDGQTAMHLACCYGTGDIIRKFIDCGANVNCRDKDGNTPLHVSRGYNEEYATISLMFNMFILLRSTLVAVNQLMWFGCWSRPRQAFRHGTIAPDVCHCTIVLKRVIWLWCSICWGWVHRTCHARHPESCRPISPVNSVSLK